MSGGSDPGPGRQIALLMVLRQVRRRSAEAAVALARADRRDAHAVALECRVQVRLACARVAQLRAERREAFGQGHPEALSRLRVLGERESAQRAELAALRLARTEQLKRLRAAALRVGDARRRFEHAVRDESRAAELESLSVTAPGSDADAESETFPTHRARRAVTRRRAA